VRYSHRFSVIVRGQQLTLEFRETGEQSSLRPSDLLSKRTGQDQSTETQDDLSAGDSDDHD